MFESLVLNFTSTLLLLTLWSRSKLALSPIDPIYLTWMREFVAFITVGIGHSAGYISDEFVITFSMVFAGYALYIVILATFFRSTYKRAVTTVLVFIERDLSSGKLFLGTCFLVYLFTSLLFFGKGGDSRLEIYQAIRPIQPVLTVFTALLMYKLLYDYIIGKRIVLLPGLILLLSIITIGGKSAIFSILLPITYLHFRKHITLTFRGVGVLFVVCLIGVTVSAILNYGVANFGTIVNLIYFRILMDSDIYILYFKIEYGNQVNLPVFFEYIWGPVLKGLGLSELVPMNLGAQIGSAAAGTTVMTGPNGQLPVVIYTYTQNYVLQLTNLSILIAVYTSIVLFVRSDLYRKSVSFSVIPLFLVGNFDQIFFDPPAYTLYFLQYVFTAVFFYITRSALIKK